MKVGENYIFAWYLCYRRQILTWIYFCC